MQLLPAPPAPGALPLFDQVRQQLQRRFDVPIRVRPAAGRFYPAGSQLWQIGSAPYLLVTRPQASQVLAGLAEPAGQQVLLLYDYVPPQLAAHLRTHHTSYADAAGNAWLRHPPLVVDVQGCPRPTAATRPASPARQVSLLRLLFQVLQQPALLGCLAPALAARTGLPLAAVAQAQARLQEAGLWPTTPDARHLAPAAGYWLQHFAPCLRRRLNPQRYCLRSAALWHEWPLAAPPAGCLWGGQAAAHLLLGRPQAPATLTLYSQVPRPQLLQQLGLIPHARGPVEVLSAFSAGDAAATCVAPLLVYADLLAGRFPSETLAQEVRARYLEPLLGS